MRYFLVGVLCVGAYLLLEPGLRGYPSAQLIADTIALLLPALVVCAGIWRRRRDWSGTHRLFWTTVLIGMALWVVGHVGWALVDLLVGQPMGFQWHPLFSLGAILGPLVATLARPHRGLRERAAGALAIDVMSFAILAGFIYAYFVLVPSLAPDQAVATERTMNVLVQGCRALLVAAMVWLAWQVGDSAWRPTYLWFAGAGAAGLALRYLSGVWASSTAIHGGALFGLAWLVPLLCYVGAVRAAPSAPRGVRGALDLPADAPSGLLSVIPVLLVPAIGYGVLGVHALGEPVDAFRILLTTLTMVTGLGLLTLRLSIQQTELHRVDARVKLLAAATEQTGDLILITRSNGLFEHANDACVRALGYSRDELAGLSLATLLDPALELTVDQIGTEVRQQGIWRGTLVHRRRDGTTFPASSTVVALRNAEGRVTHFVGVERDITEDLRLRDQLVHSERLSAVGELVAGVAHEINNPLQTIIGCAELLLDDRTTSPSQQRDLQTVRREAARAGQIVRNLLAFIRRGSPDRVAADLNHIVRTTAELREYHLVQRNVTLVRELAPGALGVLANRDEIQQIVLNLLLNAEQALVTGPGRGTIVLRTRVEAGSHVLEVVDDGPGVRPELRGRIFEPFFTTKDVGEGTGLGLSISHGIARAHGGVLELCDGGPGACFRLSLPAHDPAAETQRPALEAGAGRPSGVRRALVIDDEPPIRALLMRLLERRGYVVTETSSAEEAAAPLTTAYYEAILCDVRMQGIGGLAFVRDLRAREPRQARRVIFITGDQASIDDRGADLRDVPVLVKPFSAADLDHTLAVLDAIPTP